MGEMVAFIKFCNCSSLYIVGTPLSLGLEPGVS